MSKLAFLATLLASISNAYADGPPGACECAAPAPAAAPAPQGWDGRHVRLGFHVSSVALRARGDDLGEPQQESGAGLELAYRFGARWELAASTVHAAPAGDDAHATDLMTLTARYHLTPWRRWDFYAIAGIGGVTESADGLPVTNAGLFTAGAGVERRIRRFGLSGEVHALAAGPEKRRGATAAAMSTTNDPAMATDPSGRSGAELDLGLSYHF
jgi:hypothetical protein